jgi:hypothetical protein
MKKKPKHPHPHPNRLTNGEFQSSGGLISYQVLYDLVGRVGRLEGGVAIILALMSIILALMSIVLGVVVDGRIRG